MIIEQKPYFISWRKSLMDEMITLKTARDLLKVSRNTMYMLVRDGIIPARKVGSEWRIMRSALVEWMKQREN
jgi:excisionase family DNA binding protein